MDSEQALLRAGGPGIVGGMVRRLRIGGDRVKRLFWLQRTVVTCGWRLHGFVLMTQAQGRRWTRSWRW